MDNNNEILSLEYCFDRINRLQGRVTRLSTEIERALFDLNPDFSGDQWIARSYRSILARLTDLAAVLESNDWLLSGARLPHDMKLEEMICYPDILASVISPDAAKWRASLNEGASAALLAKDLKDVFDIYFRHDLYGRFRSPGTIFLNRGISDPWYFAPPAGVSLALNVANRQNWFGYSDPLGHIATRESVAALEQHRRQQPRITFENIAITQGATQSLTSILRLLVGQDVKGKLIIPVPTYPPLVDQVSQQFQVESLPLSKSYGWDPVETRRKLREPDVAGIVLPVPFNPTTDGSVYDELAELVQLCSQTNRYLVVVENAFADGVGGKLDPVIFPNTIIITSWSKTYGTAGLSIGHIVADRAMIDCFYRYASSAYGSPPSFLYLTCTTLADLELGYSLGFTHRLEKELAETLSSPNLLFREFGQWCEAESLYSEFHDLILGLISNIRWFDSIESVQSDPVVSSINRILCTRLEGSSYRTFLAILAAKNVSVFPVDCLAPPDERHDLRITTAVEPSQLVHGVAAIGEELDNLYALQRESGWLHPDDKIWLEEAGLFSLDTRLNFWGHLRRVQLRVQQIARAAGLTAPGYLLRAATLHDIGKVWSLLDGDRAKKEWSRIFGGSEPSCLLPFDQGEISIAKFLLFSPTGLCLPPLPSELLKLLQDFFEAREVVDSQSFWSILLDLADKSSDFKIPESATQEDLERCLQLKSIQVKRRHPQKHSDIDKEFRRTQKCLRQIYRFSRNLQENEQLMHEVEVRRP